METERIVKRVVMEESINKPGGVAGLDDEGKLSETVFPEDNRISELYRKIAELESGGFSHQNLLDNWNFSINNRGKQEYGDSNGIYGVDRWSIFTAQAYMQVLDEGIRLLSNHTTNGSGDIAQILSPEKVQRIKGRTVTFSALAKPYVTTKFRIAQGASTVLIAEESFPANEDYTLLSATMNIPSTITDEALYICIQGESNSGIAKTPLVDIKAVKLEFGEEQTLAHQENRNWILNDVFDREVENQKFINAVYPSLNGGIGAEAHRKIFRGKNLGSELTAIQKRAISNGSFDDLYVGDYWIINNVTWRIADIDYWLNRGNGSDNAFKKHHLVIVPDNCLGAIKQMNSSNSSAGGYVNSLMRTTNLNEAKGICEAAFGDNILIHQNQFTSNYGSTSDVIVWVDSTVDLMNEIMVCGSYVINPYRIFTSDNTQLALFSLAPKFMISNKTYWLRDCGSAVSFVNFTDYGPVNHNNAALEMGVRPAFAIGVH